MINSYLIFITFAACKGDEDGVTTDDYVPPRQLTLPDISDIDIQQAFTQAIQKTARIQLNPAWNGNSKVIDMGRPSCPDIYVGGPEVGEDDLRDADGQSWSDFCGNQTSLNYGGFVYWDGSITQSADNGSADGKVIDGTRTMTGQSAVKYGRDLLYEFRGTASDSMHLVQRPSNNYRQWTYSSTVEATIDGSEATGEENGFRADMYIYATGDAASTLEARGNAFWFDSRIQDRFDSVGMDIYLVDESTAGPDDCPGEPKGWIGIRDSNAYWYDLVFMPKDADDDMGYLDDERSVCDGCGTLYLRGIETTENYGTICPDFSDVWTGDWLELPTEDDYLLTIQQLLDEE